MAGHAVPGPLLLAHPAPVEAAPGVGADHVHAAAVTLGGSPRNVSCSILFCVSVRASKDFTSTEKAPRVFSWLKAPTSAFTSKTQLRHRH